LPEAVIVASFSGQPNYPRLLGINLIEDIKLSYFCRMVNGEGARAGVIVVQQYL